jgi:diguanylate cyclase (GGDEF)-like protein/PAS domain S-box-containing protein
MLAGIGATLTIAAVISVMIIHAYALADDRRQANSIVQALAGMSQGTLSTTTAAFHGAPITSVSFERERLDQLFPLEVVELQRLVPGSSEAVRFLKAFHTYHSVADREWSALLTDDRPAAARLDGAARSEFGEMLAAANVAQKALESGARQGVRVANTTSVAALVITSLFALFLLRRIGRVRRAEAIRSIQEGVLRQSEQRFRSLVQRASDMITVFSPDGTILYDSPAVERILGWTSAEREGTSIWDTIHPEDRPMLEEVKARILASPGASETVEFRRRDAAGGWRWVESTGTNMLDEPTIGGVVTNYRIVDDRKAYEGQLLTQALHDPLTSLANRDLFRDRVEHLLARRNRSDGKSAVFFLDLDDFKTVNDGLGHAAGDALLIEVGKRISGVVREGDTVARLGGDEFAVLADAIDEASGWHERLAHRMLGAMGLPFEVSGRLIFVRASIGIMLDDGTMSDADEFLRAADVAMYTAKAHGKGRYELFDAGMQMGILDRVTIEADLREGIAQRQFEVHYQPIVSLADGTLAGAEALVRWRHPDKGLLPPVEFIGVAEETGLIVPLGNLVLEQACGQLAEWRDGGAIGPDFSMSINVSVRQLQAPGLAEELMRLINDLSIDPGQLVLEITETALVNDIDLVEARIFELKATGVRIAIDDFGTGYSSLVHLRRFPIDVLKIDKSFIDGVTRGSEDSAITHAILKMADAFGIKTVAEGVERAEQQTKLRRMGCKLAQGFLFGHPVPADQWQHEGPFGPPPLPIVGAAAAGSR